MDIALTPPVSLFDKVVHRAKNSIGTNTSAVASKLSPAKTEGLHDAVSFSKLESTVIDFQKSILNYLRRNSIKLTPENESSVKEQIPTIIKLLLDMDKDPTMTKQVEIFGQNIKDLALKGKMSPDGILAVIRDIKCPEILLLPIIGEIILGAALGAAGTVIKHIVFPPPPPPPPPSPSR